MLRLVAPTGPVTSALPAGSCGVLTQENAKKECRRIMGTVLVTGGCGFIGSNLVRALLAGGHRVVNLDLMT